MINILFVLYNLNIGGAERITLNLIRGLNREKYNPKLFLVKREGELLNSISDDMEVIAALEDGETLLTNCLHVLTSLIGEARKTNLIIGALELKPSYLAIIGSFFARCPVIGWVHTDLSKYLYSASYLHRFLVPLLYPYLDRVIAVSNSASFAIKKMVPSLRCKVKVIYNPVDCDKIAKLARVEDVAAQYECPIVMGVGRLSYEKGFDILIRAHAILLAKGIRHKLIIIGDGDDRVNLEALIKHLCIEDTVELLGYKENPYIWMKNATAFVLSSRFEGLPTVLIEAMALGIPIVATDCMGSREVLDDGKYGLIAPMEDPATLADIIGSVLKNKNMREKLKILGYDRCKCFLPKIILPQFEDVIAETLEFKRLG
ncbi:glycosyl transferase [Sporomusaceae bacterium FL31]|nr:glycosyl transferase [Sporomusaceae bacterium FL31]GCE33893.1 glycosyl transferase [Sporomusaceae bacterium]